MQCGDPAGTLFCLNKMHSVFLAVEGCVGSGITSQPLSTRAIDVQLAQAGSSDSEKTMTLLCSWQAQSAEAGNMHSW
jgi:hypothetical protein